MKKFRNIHIFKFFSYDEETRTNIPVNVNVSFSLKDMLKIEEINHIFTLKEKHLNN